MFKLSYMTDKTPGYLSEFMSVSVCSLCSRKVTFPVPVWGQVYNHLSSLHVLCTLCGIPLACLSS